MSGDCAKGETGTSGTAEDEEHKKWAEEQERLKAELRGLMSSDIKTPKSEKKTEKSADDLMFEKAMGKMAKGPSTDATPKGPEKEEPPKTPAIDVAASTGPASPEAMKEEPEEEKKPAQEPKRDIPKPKDLAEKLGKVMAAEKKVEKRDEMEEEPPANEPKREIPKPRGLADMIGKVMAAEKKPEGEKIPQKVDYSRFAAKEVSLKGKDGGAAPKPEPAPTPQAPLGTPQPGSPAKKPAQPSPSQQIPVKQPVQPIPVKTPAAQPVAVKKPVSPPTPQPATPPAPQTPAKPAAPSPAQPGAKDEMGEETDAAKEAQFEEGIMVKDGDMPVKSLIELTEALITKAPEYIDLSRPKKLIHKAKEALAEGDSDEANKMAQEARQKIIEIRNDFINAKKLLKLSKERLLAAKDKGYNINKAKSHYQMALKLLKKNDHIMSMQYAKLCLREIERNEMGI